MREGSERDGDWSRLAAAHGEADDAEPASIIVQVEGSGTGCGLIRRTEKSVLPAWGGQLEARVLGTAKAALQ